MRRASSDGAVHARLAAYARRALIHAFIGVLLACIALYMIQNRLLYFPDNPPQTQLFAEARRDGLAAWPGEGDYRGLLREAAPPTLPARATVLLFHGNAGHAGHRSYYADRFSALGLRVILAEYPGYGTRPGELGEASLVADARETAARVRRQFPGALLIVGESLGAGVAAAIATAAEAEALLLITPWEALAPVARHHYPWLPVTWLLRDRYDSHANLSGFRGRVAVVVAAQDHIVPATHGQALYAGLSAPKRLWTIAGAGHNDWMDHIDGAWWQAVTDFLLEPA